MTSLSAEPNKLLTGTTSIALLAFIATIVGLPATAWAGAPGTPRSAFRIQEHWDLGGEGGWGHLFLDQAAHRLYIPRANRVMIINVDSGTLVDQVQGMVSARGIALDPSGKFGYVTDLTDGTAGFVRIFDRATLKPLASLPTGANPDSILFEPTTKSVLTLNTSGHSVTLIDTATNQVSATIPLSSRPGSAVADGSGMVFVTLPGRGEVIRIDAASAKIASTWQLGPCTGPTGLAIDAAHHQLLTTCEDHKLINIDTRTGHVSVMGSVPEGIGDMEFDPASNLLLVSDIAGNLSIYRRDSATSFSRREQVKTQPGTRTMVLSKGSDTAYLVTSKYGENTGATSEEVEFRPTAVPGSFSVIVVGHE